MMQLVKKNKFVIKFYSNNDRYTLNRNMEHPAKIQKSRKGVKMLHILEFAEHDYSFISFVELTI
jgi:hypothetical protein